MYTYIFCSLTWIEVNGSVYKQGSVVVVGMDYGMPTFGIIEDIVFCTDVFYFVCSILFTECFSHHFHAFQVHKQHPEGYVICKPSALYDTRVGCLQYFTFPVCTLKIPAYRVC